MSENGAEPHTEKGVTPILEDSVSSIHTWASHTMAHAVITMLSIVVMIIAMSWCHNQEGYHDLTSGQVLVGLVTAFFGLWWIYVHALAVWEYLAGGGETTFTLALRNTLHTFVSRDDDSIAAFTATSEFFSILLLFYICDRTPVLGRAKKHYNADTFWFLWLVLMVVALWTLKKAAKKSALPSPGQTPVPATAAPVGLLGEYFHMPLLQRDQTEEWKGWMQVMFVLYHYFHAVNLYNVIRLYIAAYVWMTGFGNFSYYYMRRDFSAMRFGQMMWRLNFFVLWVCLVLDNEYMLYYICMLHTTFTVMIYAGLGIYSHINPSFSGICLKFCVLIAITAAIWDTPRAVFDTVWFPWRPLVAFHDPYKPSRDPMHEWFFRSKLDHLIWIFGMLCAYNHPRADAFLERLDAMPPARQYSIKWFIVAVTLAVSYVWYENVFTLNKFDYNALHPFTSWIPIAAYIVLRNIFAWTRVYHMHLFEWLGKITLETYIAQFHIWMATTGPNGSPKLLLRVFPESWPLMNFAFFSIIYTYVSLRIFHSSNTMKSWCLPSKDPNGRVRFLAKVFPVAFAVLYLAAEILKRLVHSQLGWMPRQA